MAHGEAEARANLFFYESGKLRLNWLLLVHLSRGIGPNESVHHVPVQVQHRARGGLSVRVVPLPSLPPK